MVAVINSISTAQMFFSVLSDSGVIKEETQQAILSPLVIYIHVLFLIWRQQMSFIGNLIWCHLLLEVVRTSMVNCKFLRIYWRAVVN